MRIVWLTVRRITNLIWELKGEKLTYSLLMLKVNSSVLFPILNLSHQIQNVHVHTTAYIHLFQAGSLQILVGQITVGEIKIMEPHVSVQHLWIPLVGSGKKGFMALYSQYWYPLKSQDLKGIFSLMLVITSYWELISESLKNPLFHNFLNPYLL